ncbi:MAG TPA: hypothetical protein VKY19_14340 [Ktedonosporobacter sp.]|jgi:hypothetical protein|nr:hypothetical protein [Ktedonosporobacter sp.]
MSDDKPISTSPILESITKVSVGRQRGGEVMFSIHQDDIPGGTIRDAQAALEREGIAATIDTSKSRGGKILRIKEEKSLETFYGKYRHKLDEQSSRSLGLAQAMTPDRPVLDNALGAPIEVNRNEKLNGTPIDPTTLEKALKVASQLESIREGNAITAVNGRITGGTTVITEPTSRDQTAINAQKAAFKASRKDIQI